MSYPLDVIIKDVLCDTKETDLGESTATPPFLFSFNCSVVPGKNDCAVTIGSLVLMSSKEKSRILPSPPPVAITCSSLHMARLQILLP